uniref:Uncharacterized protein n=1 Tax=Desertifilum tharense IPPAS B-1220 TaxID=1781255 RepID=A0ACD5H313_9CYAN
MSPLMFPFYPIERYRQISAILQSFFPQYLSDPYIPAIVNLWVRFTLEKKLSYPALI